MFSESQKFVNIYGKYLYVLVFHKAVCRHQRCDFVRIKFLHSTGQRALIDVLCVCVCVCVCVCGREGVTACCGDEQR